MRRQALRLTSSWKWAIRGVSPAALGAVLAACGSAGGSPAGTTEPISSAALQIPLTASFTTAGATWLVLPMGHLDQVDNTFWQLFVLRKGASRWSLVTPPGFADNGGLVAAPGNGTSVVTGFQANHLIHFSPVAATSDEGKTWVPGVLGDELAAVPDALAASATGRVLALVDGNASLVLSSSGSLSVWNTLASEKSLATSPVTRSCGVTSLTAVALAGGKAIVAASCSQPGHVGIFENANGMWRTLSPQLPASMGHTITKVVRLTSTSKTVSTIVAARTGPRSVLFRAQLRFGQSRWILSDQLLLEHSEHIVSSGTSPGGGVFVSLSNGRSEGVDVTTVGGTWTQLATLPAGTDAVAFVAHNRVDAFVARNSMLIDYTLVASQDNWRRSQVIKVPIQYGSSS